MGKLAEKYIEEILVSESFPTILTVVFTALMTVMGGIFSGIVFGIAFGLVGASPLSIMIRDEAKRKGWIGNE